MKNFSRSLRTFAQAVALVALVPVAHAAEPKLPKDGWVSWQAEAVDRAPDWCCYTGWGEHNVQRTACQLEEGGNGFTISDRDATTDSVKVYVRVADGKVDKLRALAASCPVQAKTPVQELGDVTTDDSARWLISQLRKVEGTGKNESVVTMAMGALGWHRSDLAGSFLSETARKDARPEFRKKALFWLMATRGPEGVDVASAAMFNDENEEVRKHAIFALTQSRSPRIAADIIRLGNTDKAADVRALAWFWLAQTGAPEAEQAIATAVRKDTNDHVREQAVFALSQLPEERATRALIAVAEDQSLTREQRKRAIFWLSQSASDSAQQYLDRVLARAGS